MRSFKAFPIERVIAMNECDYAAVLKHFVRKAIRRIWICQFQINLYPQEDETLAVRELVRDFAGAAKRSIDVRILIDRAQGNWRIHARNAQAQSFIPHLGIPCRYYSGGKRSLHAKYVVIDDVISIVGSQNFSHGALCTHRETGVAILSCPMNTHLRQHFLFVWEQSSSEHT
jgi:phosphatidylserine/phosphatidylglycerophosphate/cardiolipin synthase-like enzyme